MAWGVLVSVLTAAIVLGGDFGVASAAGEPAVGNRILVTFEVEVLTSADVVVAHLIQPGDEQETISLSGDSAGVFRGAATVPKADLVVVFEVVQGPGDGVLSRPATLTELGLDPVLFGDLTPPIDESTPSDPDLSIGGPLTVAIISGVLSIALLAWWALSGRRAGPAEADQPSGGSETSVSAGSDSAD